MPELGHSKQVAQILVSNVEQLMTDRELQEILYGGPPLQIYDQRLMTLSVKDLTAQPPGKKGDRQHSRNMDGLILQNDAIRRKRAQAWLGAATRVYHYVAAFVANDPLLSREIEKACNLAVSNPSVLDFRNGEGEPHFDGPNAWHMCTTRLAGALGRELPATYKLNVALPLYVDTLAEAIELSSEPLKSELIKWCEPSDPETYSALVRMLCKRNETHDNDKGFARDGLQIYQEDKKISELRPEYDFRRGRVAPEEGSNIDDLGRDPATRRLADQELDEAERSLCQAMRSRDYPRTVRIRSYLASAPGFVLFWNYYAHPGHATTIMKASVARADDTFPNFDRKKYEESANAVSLASNAGPPADREDPELPRRSVASARGLVRDLYAAIHGEAAAASASILWGSKPVADLGQEILLAWHSHQEAERKGRAALAEALIAAEYPAAEVLVASESPTPAQLSTGRYAPKACALNEEWQIHWSVKHSRSYYYSAETKVTQWEVPLVAATLVPSMLHPSQSRGPSDPVLSHAQLYVLDQARLARNAAIADAKREWQRKRQRGPDGGLDRPPQRSRQDVPVSCVGVPALYGGEKEEAIRHMSRALLGGNNVWECFRCGSLNQDPAGRRYCAECGARSLVAPALGFGAGSLAAPALTFADPDPDVFRRPGLADGQPWLSSEDVHAMQRASREGTRPIQARLDERQHRLAVRDMAGFLRDRGLHDRAARLLCAVGDDQRQLLHDERGARSVGGGLMRDAGRGQGGANRRRARQGYGGEGSEVIQFMSGDMSSDSDSDCDTPPELVDANTSEDDGSGKKERKEKMSFEERKRKAAAADAKRRARATCLSGKSDESADTCGERGPTMTERGDGHHVTAAKSYIKNRSIAVPRSNSIDFRNFVARPDLTSRLHSVASMAPDLLEQALSDQVTSLQQMLNDLAPASLAAAADKDAVLGRAATLIFGAEDLDFDDAISRALVEDVLPTVEKAATVVQTSPPPHFHATKACALRTSLYGSGQCAAGLEGSPDTSTSAEKAKRAAKRKAKRERQKLAVANRAVCLVDSGCDSPSRGGSAHSSERSSERSHQNPINWVVDTGCTYHSMPHASSCSYRHMHEEKEVWELSRPHWQMSHNDASERYENAFNRTLGEHLANGASAALAGDPDTVSAEPVDPVHTGKEVAEHANPVPLGTPDGGLCYPTVANRHDDPAVSDTCDVVLHDGPSVSDTSVGGGVSSTYGGESDEVIQFMGSSVEATQKALVLSLRPICNRELLIGTADLLGLSGRVAACTSNVAILNELRIAVGAVPFTMARARDAGPCHELRAEAGRAIDGTPSLDHEAASMLNALSAPPTAAGVEAIAAALLASSSTESSGVAPTHLGASAALEAKAEGGWAGSTVPGRYRDAPTATAPNLAGSPNHIISVDTWEPLKSPRTSLSLATTHAHVSAHVSNASPKLNGEVAKLIAELAASPNLHGAASPCAATTPMQDMQRALGSPPVASVVVPHAVEFSMTTATPEMSSRSGTSPSATSPESLLLMHQTLAIKQSMNTRRGAVLSQQRAEVSRLASLVKPLIEKFALNQEASRQQMPATPSASTPAHGDGAVTAATRPRPTAAASGRSGSALAASDALRGFADPALRSFADFAPACATPETTSNSTTCQVPESLARGPDVSEHLGSEFAHCPDMRNVAVSCAPRIDQLVDDSTTGSACATSSGNNTIRESSKKRRYDEHYGAKLAEEMAKRKAKAEHDMSFRNALIFATFSCAAAMAVYNHRVTVGDAVVALTVYLGQQRALRALAKAFSAASLCLTAAGCYLAVAFVPAVIFVTLLFSHGAQAAPSGGGGNADGVITGQAVGHYPTPFAPYVSSNQTPTFMMHRLPNAAATRIAFGPAKAPSPTSRTAKAAPAEHLLDISAATNQDRRPTAWQPMQSVHSWLHWNVYTGVGGTGADSGASSDELADVIEKENRLMRYLLNCISGLYGMIPPASRDSFVESATCFFPHPDHGLPDGMPTTPSGEAIQPVRLPNDEDRNARREALKLAEHLTSHHSLVARDYFRACAEAVYDRRELPSRRSSKHAVRHVKAPGDSADPIGLWHWPGADATPEEFEAYLLRLEDRHARERRAFQDYAAASLARQGVWPGSFGASSPVATRRHGPTLAGMQSRVPCFPTDWRKWQRASAHAIHFLCAYSASALPELPGVTAWFCNEIHGSNEVLGAQVASYSPFGPPINPGVATPNFILALGYDRLNEIMFALYSSLGPGTGKARALLAGTWLTHVWPYIMRIREEEREPEADPMSRFIDWHWNVERKDDEEPPQGGSASQPYHVSSAHFQFTASSLDDDAYAFAMSHCSHRPHLVLTPQAGGAVRHGPQRANTYMFRA